MPTKEERAAKIREALLASGVKSLKEFGYPKVSPENITTDYLYSRFFLRSLKDERDALIRKGGPVVQAVVDELIAACETTNAATDAAEAKKRKRTRK